MFITVSLLNGFKKQLTYELPPTMSQVNVGDLVIVPLKNQELVARIDAITAEQPSDQAFTVRHALARVDLPKDSLYQSFLRKIATFYFTDTTKLYDKLSFFFTNQPPALVDAIPLEQQAPPSPLKATTLTDEQLAVVNFTLPFITKPSFQPLLIHGVTGSGKTEIYKKLILAAVAEKKSVLFLLPEVSLSLQFEALFKHTLPASVQVVSFHSGSTPAEKKRLWQNLHAQTPLLILGVHLPVFLPLQNLGLIIVDEEHEQGFEEKQHPKINSKQAALLRAQLYKIPIVLGSATPSLTSLHNVTHKNWHFFQLTKRFAGNFPTIQTVCLTAPSNRKRPSFWISRELEQALKACLAKKEQAIIYLNRRGFSFFVQCKLCGFVFSCPNCSVSLTAHTITKKKKAPATQQQSLVQEAETIILRCHYCTHSKKMPTCCGSCKAPEDQFIKKGIGTQQAVQILKTLFPQATIERADMDTAKKKNSWNATVAAFQEGAIDILVGTKTITKGYHFPKVTLVGILWADLNVHIPQFDASEQSLQQLIQVAGRAGRESTQSTVIVQSIQNHPIFDYLSEERYLEFAAYESEFRKEAFYPPFSRLILLELRHTNVATITKEAALVYQLLSAAVQELNAEVSILGPTTPAVHRIHKVEIRHIFLKAASYDTLHQLIGTLSAVALKSSLSISPQ